MVDLRQLIDQKIISLEKIREIYKTERDNAPTRMESRYDADRPVADHMVEALEAEINKLKLSKHRLNHLPQFSSKVQVNSIVDVKDQKGKVSRFLITPVRLGGNKIEDMSLLSEDSPLGQRLLSCSVGDTTTYSNQVFTVSSISENI